MEIETDNPYILINKDLIDTFKTALQEGEIDMVNKTYEANREYIDRYIKLVMCWKDKNWYHYTKYTNNLDSIKWIFKYVNRYDSDCKKHIKRAIFSSFFTRNDHYVVIPEPNTLGEMMDIDLNILLEFNHTESIMNNEEIFGCIKQIFKHPCSTEKGLNLVKWMKDNLDVTDNEILNGVIYSDNLDLLRQTIHKLNISTLCSTAFIMEDNEVYGLSDEVAMFLLRRFQQNLRFEAGKMIFIPSITDYCDQETYKLATDHFKILMKYAPSK